MKRAIVWFCWGERFIGEAMDSARSAMAIEADRILITDAEGATYAGGNPAFTSIIQTRLIHVNNLDKSRLIDLLPDGYDTFLFLDTDTKIVGDVSLGFEKAEQHGIAMAPAPNYNLPEFFDFARIMRELGVEPAGQMMYNTGVVFFRLTTAVRQALERWRDLCATVGAKHDFPRDQPFLTLALEQCGVTPYVLSPLYNYRGSANTRSAISASGIRTLPRRPISTILKTPGRRGALSKACGLTPAGSGRRRIAGGRRRCRNCR